MIYYLLLEWFPDEKQVHVLEFGPDPILRENDKYVKLFIVEEDFTPRVIQEWLIGFGVLENDAFLVSKFIDQKIQSVFSVHWMEKVAESGTNRDKGEVIL